MLFRFPQLKEMFRNVIYGQWYGAPAGDEQIFPVAVDEDGIVKVNSTPSYTVLADDSFNVAVTGALVFHNWIDVPNTNIMAFMVHNTHGANNITHRGIEFATGVGGAGLINAPLAEFADVIVPGNIVYLPLSGVYAANNNQPGIYHPLVAGSIRFGVRGAAATSVRVIYMGFVTP